MAKINNCLIELGVEFQTNYKLKFNGKMINPDVIISSEKQHKFLIELMGRPNVDMIFRRSFDIQEFKTETGVKTILIENFGDIKMKSLESNVT